VSEFPAIRAVPTVTAAQMAEADRIATELGVPVEALMESAAHQIARVVRSWTGGEVSGRDIVALAGSGNNGGDALAAIRWLGGWGAHVRAVLSGPPDRLRPLARKQHDLLQAVGVEIINGAADPAVARAAIGRCDVVLDGLLGYSATGAARGAVAELIHATDETRATVIAVDLPSGLDPDTGDAVGAVVRAGLTVTLALPKPGLLTDRGRHLVGTLLLADIGIPSAAFARLGIDTTGLFSSGDIVRVER
jgi:hydroxyethylthiazole kinase-like uncharacterized protein yjeF